MSDYTNDPPRGGYPDEERPRRRRDENDWPPPRPPQKSGARTALIVVGIVSAVLLVVCGGGGYLLYAAYWKVKTAAMRVQSAQNLKIISIAAQSAHDTNYRLPPSYGTYGGQEGSAFYHLLPYLEQTTVWKNRQLQTPIKTFHAAPYDPTDNVNDPVTSYAANESVLTEEGYSLAELSKAKGNANVILFAERYAERNGAWAGKTCRIRGAEGGIDFSEKPPGQEGNMAHAFNGSVCQVALADGAVKALGKDVSPEAFRWACDPKKAPTAPPGW